MRGGASGGLSELLSPEGVEARALATRLLAEGRTELAVGTALRSAGYQPSLAASVLTQITLADRATVRFGPSVAGWVWTSASLEQATRPRVARRRAARVAASGLSVVADLGCGAGADSIAMAQAGLTVRAVDIDPDALAATRHNASVAGVGDRVTVSLEDANEVDLNGVDVVMVDPARRDVAGRRLIHPGKWSPTYDQVLGFGRRVPGLVAKLAPGIDHALLPLGADTEFVQDGSDLVEATLWMGKLSSAEGRSAVLLGDASETVVTLADLPPWPPKIADVGKFVYEPHPAVIRAGLVGVVVNAVDGWLLDRAIAYTTSNDLVETPLANAYRVVDEVPFAVKKLRAELQRRNYGNVIVKKRGIAVDPEELRQSLRLTGDAGIATVVLTRTEAGPLALLVEPV